MPGKPVELPNGYHIKAALVRVGHKPVQFGPPIFRAGPTVPAAIFSKQSGNDREHTVEGVVLARRDRSDAGLNNSGLLM